MPENSKQERKTGNPIDVKRVRSAQERYVKAVQGKIVKAIDAQISELEEKHSPITPDESTIAAGVIGAGSIAGFVGLTTAATSIEALSLGQLEVPGQFLLRLGSLYGLGRMIGATVNVPYHWGVEVGHNYKWASVFKPMIPGPTDLVRFELREVWREEFRPGLLAEPTSDRFKELMAYQGYGADFADDFWAAHWDLPSVGQGFEMFHRLRPGRVEPEAVFEREDLMRLLRRLDVLLEYRDQLTAIAYRPFSRVDVRRMYRVGILDEEGVRNSYLDIGYSPENADAMTAFTLKYEAREETMEFGHTELVNLYKEGFISEDAFRLRMKQQGYGGPDIERYLGIAKLRYEYDLKTDLVKIYTDEFRKGKIEQDGFETKLAKLPMVPERIRSVVDRELAKIKLEAS